MSQIKTKTTILVFTGGGLSPSLNSSLLGVIKAAQKEGYKILGGLYGWSCLLQPNRIKDITKLKVDSLNNVGGTFLRSSRTNPSKDPKGLFKINQLIKKHSIDGIIAIGGNDTLGAANKIFEKIKLPIVGIPKTVDNDLPGTYWSPGFPSAANQLANYTAEIKNQAAYTLSRIFIIESMGQAAGWLTAAASWGGADVVVPPEKTVDTKKFLDILARRYEKNGNFAVVAVSDQARLTGIKGIVDNQSDQYNIKRQIMVSLSLQKTIKEKLGIDVRVLMPGNYLQTGIPIDIDKKMAIALGKKSITMLKKRAFGQMAIIKKQKGKITIGQKYIASTFKQGLKVMDNTFFDFDKLLPTKKYYDYLSEMLDKKNKVNPAYQKIIKQINKSL